MGRIKLTVVCKSCLNDSNPEISNLIKSLKLFSTKSKIVNGVFPCGCSIERGKTILQHHGVDEFIGTVKKYPKNTITIKECLGGKGNKRKYIFECNMCSEDSELYPYGSLTTTRSNVEQRDNPNCGCNTAKVVLSEQQHIIKVKRVCESKGLIFDGWSGDFQGTNKTRLRLICLHHGLSENTRLDKMYIGEGGCRDCAQELGNFGYYKSRSLDDDNLYLLICRSEGFVKIGRAFDIERRKYQHEKLSGYQFDLIGKVKGKHSTIFNLEQMLLLETLMFKYTTQNVYDCGSQVGFDLESACLVTELAYEDFIKII